MTHHRLVSRRIALADMGKAGLAVMVFGAAACSSTDGSASTTEANAPGTTAGASPTTSVPKEAETTTTAVSEGTEFQRVDLGFVSAYILYRAGEAALVDTGVEGSEGAIEAGLGEIGLDWGAVGHIIATHKHPDHIGSLGAVIAAAPDAAVYAGLEDIPAMLQIIEPTPVNDSDDVFGLTIVATPGHTAGHVSVLDTAAGILVAGDAMFNRDGNLTGSLPEFTEDMTIANASVRTLAGFDYETVLFGHGPPIEAGGTQAVEALAATLP
jgi:glyoxylase-like metal-dependent hydrolase (beta-lactamase superfamily II)